jgi:hypothetical protein
MQPWAEIADRNTRQSTRRGLPQGAWCRQASDHRAIADHPPRQSPVMPRPRRPAVTPFERSPRHCGSPTLAIPCYASATRQSAETALDIGTNGAAVASLTCGVAGPISDREMQIPRLGPKRRVELRLGGAHGTPTFQLLVNRSLLKALIKKLACGPRGAGQITSPTAGTAQPHAGRLASTVADPSSAAAANIRDGAEC